MNELARTRLALAGQMPYVEDFSDPQVKVIGAAALLGAIGLVVPPLLHVTALLPLAAAVAIGHFGPYNTW